MLIIQDKHDYPFLEHILIEFCASRVPVLNRRYILDSDSLDCILDACSEQRMAECRQKVLRYYLERDRKMPECGKYKSTKEQQKLLDFFGLDQTGVYHGIDNKVVADSPGQYEYRLFEFYLKGYSKLPKVECVLAKEGEGIKLNGPEGVMAEYITYLKESGYEDNPEELRRLLQEQKAIIRSNTSPMARIRLAKALTGGWGQGLKPDPRGSYSYRRGDKTLVIKVQKQSAKI